MTTLSQWADTWLQEGPQAPVALTLRQILVSAEGPDAVIFPPTYASRDPYVIDELADGTKVALIDSAGSQANRMEPIFKDTPYADLVPQITIRAGNEKIVSIFDVGHRVADALVRSSAPLAERVAEAFAELGRGNARPMAELAPTSLVFGVWDSRGEGFKMPRLVNSVIRAYDVSPLKRSAQYIPPLMPEETAQLMGVDRAKLEKAAEAGFVHVPSTDDPGGVIVHGDIRRDVSVNLVALRTKVRAGAETRVLQRYILGLALVAATWPQDGFLRQGCLLVPDDGAPAQWHVVLRDGSREAIALTHDEALAFAQEAAQDFGVGPSMEAEFDARLARDVLSKA